MIRYSTKMQFRHKLSAFVTAVNFLLMILFDSLAKNHLFALFFLISASPFGLWIFRAISGGYPVSDEEDN